MRRFVLGWKTLGYERRLRAYIVNYADDYVICCNGSAPEAMGAMRTLMTRLKLAVNEEKTRLGRLPDDSVDFLGYTIGRCYARQTGRAYIGTKPSRRSVQRLCQAISERTTRRWRWLDAKSQVEHINRLLTGWANYFRLGSVSKAYQTVDGHTRLRLRRWLCRKHGQRGKGVTRFSREYLTQLGLIRLGDRRHNGPWATV